LKQQLSHVEQPSPANKTLEVRPLNTNEDLRKNYKIYMESTSQFPSSITTSTGIPQTVSLSGQTKQLFTERVHAKSIGG
jgi:hypothetical protein